MQIKKKLPLVMITLICVPLLILAIIIYAYSSRTLIEKSKNNIAQLAATEGKALATLIEARTYQVKTLATDERVIEVLKLNTTNQIEEEQDKYAKTKELLKQVCIENAFYEAFIIDKKGNIIVASNDQNRAYRVGDKEGYEEVLQGKTVVSNMVLSYVDGARVINITAPVRSKEGQIMGAVCKVIFNTDFSEFVKDIKVDRTGYAYILDNKGFIIGHPDPTKEGKCIDNEKIYNIIKNNTYSEKLRTGIDTYNYEGQKKYVSYYRIEGINWGIFICQNQEEVKQQAFTEFLLIIFTTIGLMAAVIVVSMVITKKITGPIDNLIEVMRSTENGDLDQYYEYNVADEFGTLAIHYNHMLKRLGDSKRNLDKIFVALIESKEALSISEERYKQTLDGIEEVIWEYNIENKKFFATDKWYELVGDSNQDIDIISTLKKILQPGAMASFQITLNRCIGGEQETFDQELLATLLNGQQKWLLCKGKVIKKEGGHVEKIVGILMDVTCNKMNEEKVRKLAYFDTLTGFLNKPTFMETLGGWLEPYGEIRNAALLFIDLDDFKKVNDTLGHDIGDKLINHVAKCIKDIIPQDTFISRFGGDEFVIFKTVFKEIDEIQELIYSILNIFKEELIIETHSIHITCSMGVALYPLDGQTSDILLKNADTAMYKAKASGKNSYRFYAEDMSKLLDRKLLIESVLREAITSDSLYLQYQPIVDLNTGRTVATEALIRLKHDKTGFVSPGEFIPIAEETGLIVPIGNWVLETALKELNYCRLLGHEELKMSINVSSIQMKEPSFIDKLKLTVEKMQVPPAHIKIEMTETTLMENLENSKLLFNKIKELGMQIALDDFGTGYSSLNYLRNIPIDILKIDKSFIDEITTSQVLSEIVDSIINMAHILEILVVAEGVESEEQLKILKDKGCDLVQGYVYSKPLLSTELEERLEREKRDITKKECS